MAKTTKPRARRKASHATEDDGRKATLAALKRAYRMEQEILRITRRIAKARATSDAAVDGLVFGEQEQPAHRTQPPAPEDGK